MPPPVVPVARKSLMRCFTVAASVSSERGVGQFRLFASFTGEFRANVNNAILVGVPVKSSTNCVAADCTLGKLEPIEPDRSKSMATVTPHFSTGGTLSLTFAHLQGVPLLLVGRSGHVWVPLTMLVVGTWTVPPASTLTFHL